MTDELSNIMGFLPPSIANLQLPDDGLLRFYESVENRTFWIIDKINTYSLDLIHYILKCNREDALNNIPIEERKPIKLMFFCLGGDLDVNYTLFDIIKMSETPIYGYNVGRCCSAAAYIYLACSKRFMLPHAYFLFHQGSGVMQGSFAEIAASMQDYQEQVNELSVIMQEKTKYTEEEIAENITKEWYVRQEEALEKQVCNSIVDNISSLL